MYKSIFILLLCCLLSNKTDAQAGLSQISGRVFDQTTGEVLVGAVIYDKNNQNGTTTNEMGYYSFKLGANHSEIIISFIGYETQHLPIDSSLAIRNIRLKPTDTVLDEVIVKGVKNNSATEVSSFMVNKTELLALPSLAAEPDLIQYMQLSAGVSNPGDGNSNLYVRGGGHDQNLFLLDNIPLFHVAHFGGFFSTFNADIINSAKLHKGGFPARFGGRLSSVVDIHAYDGDMFKYNGSGTLGLLFSKISLNGPIVKGKSSFLVSARKNTLPFFKLMGSENIKFNFYDVNAKMSTKISEKDKLYLSFYNGNDLFGFSAGGDSIGTNDNTISWGNMAAALRYNRVLMPGLFGNFIVGHSKYHYNEHSLSKIDSLHSSEYFHFENDFESSISCAFAKAHFEYNIDNSLRVFAGYELNRYGFNPGSSYIKRDYTELPLLEGVFAYANSFSIENSFFGEFIFNNIFGFSGNIGIRPSVLSAQGNNFISFQPRLTLSFSPADAIRLKASYSKINQAFHVLSTTGSGFSSDYRIPVFDFAPPSVSDQLVLGVDYSLGTSFDFSCELYTKFMDNMVMLKDGVRYTNSYDTWEKTIETGGQGLSRGLELTLRKTQGQFTGWVAYCWSSSTRRFENINNGNPFPFDFDRTHEVNINGHYTISESISLGASWSYGTGIPANLPTWYFTDIDDNHLFVYKGYNAERLKDFHRLDLSMILKGERGEWNISVINAYKRKNIYYYSIVVLDNKPVLNEKSLFSLIPTLSYTFKF